MTDKPLKIPYRQRVQLSDSVLAYLHDFSTSFPHEGDINSLLLQCLTALKVLRDVKCAGAVAPIPEPSSTSEVRPKSKLAGLLK